MPKVANLVARAKGKAKNLLSAARRVTAPGPAATGATLENLAAARRQAELSKLRSVVRKKRFEAAMSAARAASSSNERRRVQPGRSLRVLPPIRENAEVAEVQGYQPRARTPSEEIRFQEILRQQGRAAAAERVVRLLRQRQPGRKQFQKWRQQTVKRTAARKQPAGPAPSSIRGNFRLGLVMSADVHRNAERYPGTKKTNKNGLTRLPARTWDEVYGQERKNQAAELNAQWKRLKTQPSQAAKNAEINAKTWERMFSKHLRDFGLHVFDDFGELKSKLRPHVTKIVQKVHAQDERQPSSAALNREIEARVAAQLSNWHGRHKAYAPGGAGANNKFKLMASGALAAPVAVRRSGETNTNLGARLKQEFAGAAPWGVVTNSLRRFALMGRRENLANILKYKNTLENKIKEYSAPVGKKLVAGQLINDPGQLESRKLARKVMERQLKTIEKFAKYKNLAVKPRNSAEAARASVMWGDKLKEMQNLATKELENLQPTEPKYSPMKRTVRNNISFAQLRSGRWKAENFDYTNAEKKEMEKLRSSELPTPVAKKLWEELLVEIAKRRQEPKKIKLEPPQWVKIRWVAGAAVPRWWWAGMKYKASDIKKFGWTKQQVAAAEKRENNDRIFDFNAKWRNWPKPPIAQWMAEINLPNGPPVNTNELEPSKGPPPKRNSALKTGNNAKAAFDVIKTAPNGDCFYAAFLLARDKGEPKGLLGVLITALRQRIRGYYMEKYRNFENNAVVNVNKNNKPLTKSAFLNYVTTKGAWAGQAEMAATSLLEKTSIIVYTPSFKIHPQLTFKNPAYTKTVHILYDAEPNKMGSHFDALVPKTGNKPPSPNKNATARQSPRPNKNAAALKRQGPKGSMQGGRLRPPPNVRIISDDEMRKFAKGSEAAAEGLQSALVLNESERTTNQVMDKLGPMAEALKYLVEGQEKLDVRMGRLEGEVKAQGEAGQETTMAAVGAVGAKLGGLGVKNLMVAEATHEVASATLGQVRAAAKQKTTWLQLLRERKFRELTSVVQKALVTNALNMAKMGPKLTLLAIWTSIKGTAAAARVLLYTPPIGMFLVAGVVSMILTTVVSTVTWASSLDEASVVEMCNELNNHNVCVVGNLGLALKKFSVSIINYTWVNFLEAPSSVFGNTAGGFAGWVSVGWKGVKYGGRLVGGFGSQVLGQVSKVRVGLRRGLYLNEPAWKAGPMPNPIMNIAAALPDLRQKIYEYKARLLKLPKNIWNYPGSLARRGGALVRAHPAAAQAFGVFTMITLLEYKKQVWKKGLRRRVSPRRRGPGPLDAWMANMERRWAVGRGAQRISPNAANAFEKKLNANIKKVETNLKGASNTNKGVLENKLARLRALRQNTHGNTTAGRREAAAAQQVAKAAQGNNKK